MEKEIEDNIKKLKTFNTNKIKVLRNIENLWTRNPSTLNLSKYLF